MLDLDMTSILLLLGAVAAGAVSYYVLRVAREWLKRNRPIGGTIRRAVVPDLSLDTHIATQWTDGRLRLDFLLALIKKLEAALEQEVETLRRLGHADPQYRDQARQMVEPNLRELNESISRRLAAHAGAPAAAGACAWRSASQSSIIAPERRAAVGLARPCPMISGAVP